VNEERPHRRSGKALPAVALHAREGQQAGHLPGAANKQRHGAAVLAAHMDLPFEEKHHPLRRSAFFKQHIAGVGHKLLAVPGQPQAVFQRQPVQRTNALQGSRNLFSGRGTGRRLDGRGKHPGPPGAPSE